MPRLALRLVRASKARERLGVLKVTSRASTAGYAGARSAAARASRPPARDEPAAGGTLRSQIREIFNRRHPRQLRLRLRRRAEHVLELRALHAVHLRPA